MANTELIRIAGLSDAERKIITAFLSTQERKEVLLQAAQAKQQENDVALEKERNDMSNEKWCGTCQSDVCWVESGAVCCHNKVRYGYCDHNRVLDEPVHEYGDSDVSEEDRTHRHTPSPELQARRVNRPARPASPRR
jgi:hypothetical protein